jgi:PAS domain S-box-containing protein
MPAGTVFVTARAPEADDLADRVLRQYPDDALLVFDHELRYPIRGGKMRVAAAGGHGVLPAGSMADYIGPAEAARLEAAQRRALSGARAELDIVVAGRLNQVTLDPVRDAAGAITHGLLIARDVTEQRAATAELAEQLALHDALLSVFPNGVVLVCDQDLRFRMAGGAAMGPAGYVAEHFIGRTLMETFPPESIHAFETSFRLALKGEANTFRYDSSGGRRFLIHAVPMLRDATGRVTRALVMTQDITAAEAAAARVQAALDEKSVLLEEVHHRVKNNLQVVSSLLRMQARRLDDPAALRALDECRRRVLVMADIHRQLYSTRDVAEVPLSATLRHIGEGVVRANARPGLTVTLAPALQDGVVARLDRAMPVALIVHELLTNSMQHAWPAGGSGRLGLALVESGEGSLEIVVEDDGVGQPDAGPGDGLGRRLVHALARQAGADLSYAVDGGTRWTLRLSPLPAS